MKRVLMIILLPLVGWNSIAFAQTTESQHFPDRGRSTHISTSLFHSLISGNTERYKHSANGKHHWGMGAGLSAGWGYFGPGVGAHVMVSYWSGRGKNHFETRLGVAPTYFFGSDNEDAVFFPVPILLFGYRHQKPGSDRFFSLHLGSAGLGIGFGKTFDGN